MSLQSVCACPWGAARPVTDPGEWAQGLTCGRPGHDLSQSLWSQRRPTTEASKDIQTSVSLGQGLFQAASSVINRKGTSPQTSFLHITPTLSGHLLASRGETHSQDRQLRRPGQPEPRAVPSGPHQLLTHANAEGADWITANRKATQNHEAAGWPQQCKVTLPVRLLWPGRASQGSLHNS